MSASLSRTASKYNAFARSHDGFAWCRGDGESKWKEIGLPGLPDSSIIYSSQYLQQAEWHLVWNNAKVKIAEDNTSQAGEKAVLGIKASFLEVAHVEGGERQKIISPQKAVLLFGNSIVPSLLYTTTYNKPMLQALEDT